MKTITNTLITLAFASTLFASVNASAGRPTVGGGNVFANKLVCSLPAEVGRCRAAFRRWANVNGQCVVFTYGGCGGNANNFETKAQCEATCHPQSNESNQQD